MLVLSEVVGYSKQKLHTEVAEEVAVAKCKVVAVVLLVEEDLAVVEVLQRPEHWFSQVGLFKVSLWFLAVVNIQALLLSLSAERVVEQLVQPSYQVAQLQVLLLTMEAQVTMVLLQFSLVALAQ
jgi:hypothetical protein